MNLTYLQDDPKVDWKVEIIAPIIVKFIETLDIGMYMFHSHFRKLICSIFSLIKIYF
jgi:hypothetical protein